MRRIYVAFLIVVLAACGGNAGRPASELLPNLGEEYKLVTMQDLANGLENIQDSMIMTLLPPGNVAIGAIDRTISCLNKTGAAAMNFYIYQQDPHLAGVAAAVNQSRLLSVDTLMQCVNPSSGSTQNNAFQFEPCVKTWVYDEAGTKYHMLYAGTSPVICEQMCSLMNGCTAG